MADTNAPRVRSLRSPQAAAYRRQMLQERHIAPLAAFTERLRRAHPGWEFPDFDPLDGGSNADLMFLLEKPGPMTSIGGGGSGFISRDNDNPTAEAIFNFMNKASLPRERTVVWNIVPGWNGTCKVTTKELVAGVDSFAGLLPLLPKLRTIVLVGRKAQRLSSKRSVCACSFRRIPHLKCAHRSRMSGAGFR